MSEMLEREIAALPKMNITELRAKWRRDLKQAPPPHVRKQLVVPLLAYKLQEQAYGGLRLEDKAPSEKDRWSASYQQEIATQKVAFALDSKTQSSPARAFSDNGMAKRTRSR